jgi:hypothetical protein
MFNNPSPIDYSFEEGTVTEVDSIRRLCKVKTLSGQNLNGVYWPQPSGGSSRAGDRLSPHLGDRVKIHTGLGSPIISSFLPRLQNAENIFPMAIDSGEQLIDTGSFSPAGDSIQADQNASKDMLVGDRIITSQGGGLLGVLRGGSLLLRSSRLAEIFLSKWDDMVRIVSRNYQHYTDLSSTVIQNVGGRVYGYVGIGKLFKESKVEDYKYHQYFGDVALAEKAKTDYSLLDVLPAVDARVYKEQVTQGSGGASKELLRRELSLDGTHDLVVLDSTGAIFTRIKSTNGEITITYKDINIIKINADQINLTKGGDPTINMDDTGITCTFKGAVAKLIDDGIHATYQGAELKMIADGIHATKGSSEMKVISSGVYNTCGGHFMNVTAGGVALG